MITFLVWLCLVTTGFSQEVKNTSPFILGEIHQIESSILGEQRTVNIYLPEGYLPTSKETYPVVYLLDGSKDEDFIHTVGLVQYNTFPWVNRMPKSIVVGISNSDRKRDFTFPTTIKKDKKRYSTSGHSESFIQFLTKELKPYIESTFKTNSKATLIGQSLGGLLAAEILIKQPTLFSDYIIISPSLWWDNRSLLKDISKLSDLLEEKLKGKTLNIYIGVGKEGHGNGGNSPLMEDDAKLFYEKLNGIKQINSTYDFLPKENHATVGHQALINAFIWLNK